MGAGVVGRAVGVAVVGDAVGVAVVGAAVGAGVGLGLELGTSVAGTAVRIWTVGLDDADADGLASPPLLVVLVIV